MLRAPLPVFAALIIATASACGGHVRPGLPKAPASALQAQGETDGLRVAAEPYADPKRQRSLFERDLAAEGLLPVLVVVGNTGDRPLLLRRRWILLDVAGEHPLVASASAETVERVLGGNGVRWNRAVGSYGGRSYRTIELGLGYLFGTALSDKTEAAHYSAWEMPDRALVAPGQSLRGFVYFEPAATAQPFDEATLRVRFRVRRGSQSALPDGSVEIPLRDLRFGSAQ